jgi:hypothetical protein
MKIIQSIEATGLKINVAQSREPSNNTANEGKREPKTLVERYSSNEGVSRARVKLEKYLKGESEGLGGGRVDLDSREGWVGIQRVLYAMLTTRESYYSLQARFANAALMLNDPEVRMGNETYGRNLQQAEAQLLSLPGFSQDSNPAWWGINTNADAPTIDADNVKVYATISTANPDFITHLPSLAVELQQLSKQTGDIIKLKVPRRYSDFLQFSDCLVIHHKKNENAVAIQTVLDRWIKAHNIQKETRALGRTTTANDTKEGSFSDTVAQQAMDETREMFLRLPTDQKYSEQTARQLSDYAINRALELSQQS